MHLTSRSIAYHSKWLAVDNNVTRYWENGICGINVVVDLSFIGIIENQITVQVLDLKLWQQQFSGKWITIVAGTRYSG